MREQVDYQHFATLAERVAVSVERLENICRRLESYETKQEDFEVRLRKLEDDKNLHAGKITGGGIAIGAFVTAVTIFLYYHMSDLNK